MDRSSLYYGREDWQSHQKLANSARSFVRTSFDVDPDSRALKEFVEGPGERKLYVAHRSRSTNYENTRLAVERYPGKVIELSPKTNENFPHYKKGILKDSQGVEWLYDGTANMTQSGMGETVSSRAKNSVYFASGDRLQENNFLITNNKEMIREWKFLATRAGIPGYADNRTFEEQKKLPLVSTKHFRVISAGDRSTYFNEIYSYLETGENVSMLFTTLSDEGIIRRIINRSRLGSHTRVVIGGTSDRDIENQKKTLETLLEGSKRYPSLEVGISVRPSHRNMFAVGTRVAHMGDARASKSMSTNNNGYSTMISTRLEDAGFAEFVHNSIAQAGNLNKFPEGTRQKPGPLYQSPRRSDRYDFMVDALMPRAASMPKPGVGDRWQYTVDPRMIYDARFVHASMYMASSQFYQQMIRTRSNTDYDIIRYDGITTYSPKKFSSGILSHMYASSYERSTGERMDYQTMPLEIRALDYLMQQPTAGYMLKAYAGSHYGPTAAYLIEQRGNRGPLGSFMVNVGRYLDHHKYTTGLETFLYSGGYNPKPPDPRSEPFTHAFRYAADAASNLGSFLMLYYMTHFLHSISADATDYITKGAREYQTKVNAATGPSSSLGQKLYAGGLNKTMAGFAKATGLTFAFARTVFSNTVYPLVENLVGIRASQPYYNTVMEALDDPAHKAHRMSKPGAIELTARIRSRMITGASQDLAKHIPFMNIFTEDVTIHDDLYLKSGRDQNTLAVKHFLRGSFREAADSWKKANRYFANARASAYGYAKVSPERIGVRTAVRGFAAFNVLSGFVGDMLASKPFLLSHQIEAEKLVNERRAYDGKVSYLTPSYLLPQNIGELPPALLGAGTAMLGYPAQTFMAEGAVGKLGSIVGFALGAAATRGRGFRTFLAALAAGTIAGGIGELVSGRGFQSFRRAAEKFAVPKSLIVQNADGTKEELGAFTFMYSQGFRRFDSVTGALSSVAEFVANTPTALYRNVIKMMQADRDNFSWKVVTREQAAAMTISDRMRQLDNQGFAGRIDGDPGVVQSSIQRTLDVFRNFSVNVVKSEINQMSITGLRVGWMGGPALFFSASTQGGRTSFAASFISPLPYQVSGTMSLPFYIMEKRGYKQLDYWLQNKRESNNFFDRKLYDLIKDRENSAAGMAAKVALGMLSLGYKPSTLVEALIQLNIGVTSTIGPVNTFIGVAGSVFLANQMAKRHYQSRELFLKGTKSAPTSIFARVAGYLKYGESTRVSLDPLANIGMALTSEPRGVGLGRLVGTLLQAPGAVARGILRVAALPVTGTLGVAVGGAVKLRRGSFRQGFMGTVRAGEGIASIALTLAMYDASRILYNLHKKNYEGTPGAYIDAEINRYKLNFGDASTAVGALAATINRYVRSGFRLMINANTGERRTSLVQPIIISSPTSSFPVEMDPIVGKFPLTPKGSMQRIHWSLRKIFSSFSSENVLQSPEIVALQHGDAAASQTQRDEDTTGFTRIKGRISLFAGQLFTVSNNRIASTRPQKPKDMDLGSSVLAMATHGTLALVMGGFGPPRKPAFMGRMFSSESPVYRLSPGLKLAVRNRQALTRVGLSSWSAPFNDYLSGNASYQGGYARLPRQAYYTHYAAGRYDSQNNPINGVRPVIVNPLRTAPGMKPYDSYDFSELADKFAGYAQRFYNTADEKGVLDAEKINDSYLGIIEQSSTLRAIVANIELRNQASRTAGMPVTEIDDDAEIMGGQPYSMDTPTLRALSRNATPEEFMLNFMNSDTNKFQQSLIGTIWLGFVVGSLAVFSGRLVARTRSWNAGRLDPAQRAINNVVKNLRADDPLRGMDVRRMMRSVEVIPASGIIKPTGVAYAPSDSSILKMPRPGGGYSLLGAANGMPFGEGATNPGSVSGLQRAQGFQQVARSVIEAYGDIKGLAETRDITRTLSTIRRLELILESVAGHGPGTPAPPPGWAPSAQYNRTMTELRDISNRLRAGGNFGDEISNLERTVFRLFRDFDDVMGLKPADMPGFLKRAGVSTFGMMRYWLLNLSGTATEVLKRGASGLPRSGLMGTMDPSHHTASTAAEEHTSQTNLKASWASRKFAGIKKGVSLLGRGSSAMAGLALFGAALNPNTSIESSVGLGLGGLGLFALSAYGIRAPLAALNAYVKVTLGHDVYSGLSNTIMAADPALTKEQQSVFRTQAASSLTSAALIGAGLLTTVKLATKFTGFWGQIASHAINIGLLGISSYLGRTQYEQALYKERQGENLNFTDKLNKFVIGGGASAIGFVQDSVNSVSAFRAVNEYMSSAARQLNIGVAGFLNQTAGKMNKAALDSSFGSLAVKPLKIGAAALSTWADNLVDSQIRAGLIERGDAGEASFSFRHSLWRSYSPIFYGVASERSWMLAASEFEVAEQIGYTKRGIGSSLFTMVAPDLIRSYSNTGLMSSSNDNLLNMSFESMYMARPRTGGGNISARRAFQFAPVPGVDDIIMAELHRRALMYEVGVLGGANAMRNYMFTGGFSGFETRGRTSPQAEAEGAVPSRKTVLQTLAEVMGGPARPAYSGAGSVPTKYSAFIADASKRYGESESFIRAIMQAETGGVYNERLVSPRGAEGLMQVVPRFHNPDGKLNLFDPQTSILKGTSILADFRKELGRQLGRPATDAEVAAAYNAGVKGFMASKAPGGKLPLETQSYIKQVEYYKFINQRLSKVKDIEKTEDLVSTLQSGLGIGKSEAAEVAKRFRTTLARSGQYLPYDDPETYNQVNHLLAYTPTRKQRAELLHSAVMRVLPNPAGSPVLTEQGIGFSFTSGFLEDRGTHRHSGVDIQFYDKQTGSREVPVVSFTAGRVIEYGPKGAYGNVVIIRSNEKVNGKFVDYLYGHLAGGSEDFSGLQVGAVVAAGERIGIQGQTGRATGPHVHFERRVGGTFHDPMEMPAPVETYGKKVPSASEIEAYLGRNKDAARNRPGAYAKMWKHFGFSQAVAQRAEDFYNQTFTRRGTLLPGLKEPVKLTLNPDAYTDSGERSEKKNYYDITKNRNEGGEHRRLEEDEDNWYHLGGMLLTAVISAFTTYYQWKKISKQRSLINAKPPVVHDAVLGVELLVSGFNEATEKLSSVPDSPTSRILATDPMEPVAVRSGVVSQVSLGESNTTAPIDFLGLRLGSSGGVVVPVVSPEFIADYDAIRQYDETKGQKEQRRTLAGLKTALENKKRRTGAMWTHQEEDRLQEVTAELEQLDIERTNNVGAELNRISNSVLGAIEHMLGSSSLVESSTNVTTTLPKHRNKVPGSSVVFTSASPDVETLVSASIRRGAALNLRARIMRQVDKLNFLRLPHTFGEDKTGLPEGRLQQGVAAMQHLAKVVEHVNRRFGIDPDTGRNKAQYKERRASLLARLATHSGSATDQLQFIAEAIVEGTGLKQGANRTDIVNEVTMELVKMFGDMSKLGPGGPVQLPRGINKPGRRRGKGLVAKTNKMGDTVTIGRVGSAHQVDIDVNETTQHLMNRTLENIFLIINRRPPNSGTGGAPGGTGPATPSGQQSLFGSPTPSTTGPLVPSSPTQPLTPGTQPLVSTGAGTGFINSNSAKTGTLNSTQRVIGYTSGLVNNLYQKVKSVANKLAGRVILPAIALTMLYAMPAEAATTAAQHYSSSATTLLHVAGYALGFAASVRVLRAAARAFGFGPKRLIPKRKPTKAEILDRLAQLNQDPDYRFRQRLLHDAVNVASGLFAGAPSITAHLLSSSEEKFVYGTELGKTDGGHYAGHKDFPHITLSDDLADLLVKTLKQNYRVLTSEQTEAYHALLHELRHDRSQVLRSRNLDYRKDLQRLESVRNSSFRSIKDLLNRLVTKSAVNSNSKRRKALWKQRLAFEEASVEIGTLEHLTDFLAAFGRAPSYDPIGSAYLNARVLYQAMLDVSGLSNDQLYAAKDRAAFFADALSTRLNLSKKQRNRIEALTNATGKRFLPSNYSGSTMSGEYGKAATETRKFYKRLEKIVGPRRLPKLSLLPPTADYVVIQDVEFEKQQRAAQRAARGLGRLPVIALVGFGLASVGLPAEAATTLGDAHTVTLSSSALLPVVLGVAGFGFAVSSAIQKITSSLFTQRRVLEESRLQGSIATTAEYARSEHHAENGAMLKNLVRALELTIDNRATSRANVLLSNSEYTGLLRDYYVNPQAIGSWLPGERIVRVEDSVVNDLSAAFKRGVGTTLSNQELNSLAVVFHEMLHSASAKNISQEEYFKAQKTAFDKYNQSGKTPIDLMLFNIKYEANLRRHLKTYGPAQRLEEGLVESLATDSELLGKFASHLGFKIAEGQNQVSPVYVLERAYYMSMLAVQGRSIHNFDENLYLDKDRVLAFSKHKGFVNRSLYNKTMTALRMLETLQEPSSRIRKLATLTINYPRAGFTAIKSFKAFLKNDYRTTGTALLDGLIEYMRATVNRPKTTTGSDKVYAGLGAIDDVTQNLVRTIKPTSLLPAVALGLGLASVGMPAEAATMADYSSGIPHLLEQMKGVFIAGGIGFAAVALAPTFAPILDTARSRVTSARSRVTKAYDKAKYGMLRLVDNFKYRLEKLEPGHIKLQIDIDRIDRRALAPSYNQEILEKATTALTTAVGGARSLAVGLFSNSAAKRLGLPNIFRNEVEAFWHPQNRSIVLQDYIFTDISNVFGRGKGTTLSANELRSFAVLLHELLHSASPYVANHSKEIDAALEKNAQRYERSFKTLLAGLRYTLKYDQIQKKAGLDLSTIEEGIVESIATDTKTLKTFVESMGFKVEDGASIPENQKTYPSQRMFYRTLAVASGGLDFTELHLASDRINLFAKTLSLSTRMVGTFTKDKHLPLIFRRAKYYKLEERIEKLTDKTAKLNWQLALSTGSKTETASLLFKAAVQYPGAVLSTLRSTAGSWSDSHNLFTHLQTAINADYAIKLGKLTGQSGQKIFEQVLQDDTYIGGRKRYTESREKLFGKYFGIGALALGFASLGMPAEAATLGSLHNTLYGILEPVLPLVVSASVVAPLALLATRYSDQLRSFAGRVKREYEIYKRFRGGSFTPPPTTPKALDDFGALPELPEAEAKSIRPQARTEIRNLTREDVLTSNTTRRSLSEADFDGTKRSLSRLYTRKTYYHGQTYVPYGIPSLEESGSWEAGKGFYITPSLKVAESYAGGRTDSNSNVRSYVQTFEFKRGARVMDFMADYTIYEQELKAISRDLINTLTIEAREQPSYLLEPLTPEKLLRLAILAEKPRFGYSAKLPVVTVQDIVANMQDIIANQTNILDLTFRSNVNLDTLVKYSISNTLRKIGYAAFRLPLFVGTTDQLIVVDNTALRERRVHTYIHDYTGLSTHYKAAVGAFKSAIKLLMRKSSDIVATSLKSTTIDNAATHPDKAPRVPKDGYLYATERLTAASERDLTALRAARTAAKDRTGPRGLRILFERRREAEQRILFERRYEAEMRILFERRYKAERLEHEAELAARYEDLPLLTRTPNPALEFKRKLLERKAAREADKSRGVVPERPLTQLELAEERAQKALAVKDAARTRIAALQGQRPLDVLSQKETEINRQKELKEKIWARLGTAGRPLDVLAAKEDKIRSEMQRKAEIKLRLSGRSRWGYRSFAEHERRERIILDAKAIADRRRALFTSGTDVFHRATGVGNPLFMAFMSIKGMHDMRAQNEQFRKMGLEMPLSEQLFHYGTAGAFALQGVSETYARTVDLFTNNANTLRRAAVINAVSSKISMPLMIGSEVASTYFEYRNAGGNKAERIKALSHGLAGFAAIGVSTLVGIGLTLALAPVAATAGVVGGAGLAVLSIAGGIGSFTVTDELVSKAFDENIDRHYAQRTRDNRIKRDLKSAKRNKELGLIGSLEAAHAPTVKEQERDGGLLEAVDTFIQEKLASPSKEDVPLKPLPSHNVVVTVDTKDTTEVRKGQKDIPAGTTKDHTQRKTTKVEVTGEGKKVVVHREHGIKKGKDDTLDRDYHKQGRRGSRDMPDAGRRRPQ